MLRARSAIAFLLAAALAGAVTTPCPGSQAAPDDAALRAHVAHHAAAPAAEREPAPGGEGWCSGAPAPPAHLAPVCPCGCGDRDSAPGSTLGWVLLPAPATRLAPSPAAAPATRAPALASLPSPGLDHVPLA